jgi:hypothetical protein
LGRWSNYKRRFKLIKQLILNKDKNMSEVRKMTNKLLSMVDEGIVDPSHLIVALLKHMSEDEVSEFMYDEELISEEICDECGNDKKDFVHMCDHNSVVLEIYGCAEHDDVCIHCRSEI